jgi:hypothetical protein
MEKLYKLYYNIGKSKYVVSYYDGIKKHNDGSRFYDMAIFKNKRKLKQFIKELDSQQYQKF